MSVIKKLQKNKLISPPHPFCVSTHYEVMMGSVAYNVSTDTSDMDVHAICIPDVNMIFPHLTGYINGFGPTPKNFDVYQSHNIIKDTKNYDVVIYSIVKVFALAAENNPNILDMLWVPENCILSMDEIGKHIRYNRRNFLAKSSYHKFRGYSHAQLKKLVNTPRVELVEKYGYDTKHAYHIVRLLEQCRQILEQGDMDITLCSEMLKSIRRGEWALQDLHNYIKTNELILDKLYHESKLPNHPDYTFLRKVLMDCIEMKYGSIAQMSSSEDMEARLKIKQIQQILSA